VLGVVRGAYLALAVVFSIVLSLFHSASVSNPQVKVPTPHLITIDYYGNSLGTKPHHHKTVVKKRVTMASDYMSILPSASRPHFICVMWVESRSTPTNLHPTDYDTRYSPYSEATGIFQFEASTWQSVAKALGIRAMYAFQASITDQFRAAAWYWLRDGGLKPNWQENC